MVSQEYIDLVKEKNINKIDLDNFVLMNILYSNFEVIDEHARSDLHILEKYFFKKIIEKENTNKIFIEQFNNLILNEASNYFIIEYLNSRFDLIFEIV